MVLWEWTPLLVGVVVMERWDNYALLITGFFVIFQNLKHSVLFLVFGQFFPLSKCGVLLPNSIPRTHAPKVFASMLPSITPFIFKGAFTHYKKLWASLGMEISAFLPHYCKGNYPIFKNYIFSSVLQFWWTMKPVRPVRPDHSGPISWGTKPTKSTRLRANSLIPLRIHAPACLACIQTISTFPTIHHGAWRHPGWNLCHEAWNEWDTQGEAVGQACMHALLWDHNINYKEVGRSVAAFAFKSGSLLMIYCLGIWLCWRGGRVC